ncbi:MAG: DUF1648 domain-containing protein [Chlorobi bacterium]|nr:DUF1648 domain-containing protein [Chlorobiota bacterium]
MKDSIKIKTQIDNTSKILDIILMLSLLAAVLVPIYYYQNLPDLIPSHFDMKGNVDSYAGKATILIIPALLLVMAIGMRLLQNYPHIFNYPVKITEQNAEFQYKMAQRFIALINIWVVLLMMGIEIIIIKSAMGNYSSMDIVFVLSFIAVLFLAMIIYFIKAKKHS